MTKAVEEQHLENKQKNTRRKHLYTVGGKGLSPGTMVFVGEQKTLEARMDITCYDEKTLQEQQNASLEDFARLNTKNNVTWLNIIGIHDTALIETVGKTFGLHPLTLEDIVNTTQRPKAEEFDHYIFLVLKMTFYNEEKHEIELENVSLILGEDFVLSFQEKEGDVFDPVRARIRKAKGRIRKSGPDYLAYALMDALIDEYFTVLEKTGEYIEVLDDEIMFNPQNTHLHKVHRLKQNMLFLRKAVWPLREEVAAIEKDESKLIKKSTRAYLRHLYDHTIQVIDMVETYRDILGGMNDTYLSSINNRMNDIMKVLTIMASLFIPLTFIAGVYGMNFENMPELEWEYAYFIALSVMAILAGLMLLLFKKKGWFG